MMKTAFSDRRKRARIALRCAVRLRHPSAENWLHAETQNLSSEGFYCLAPEAFDPGEVIECIMALPPNQPSERRTLCCQATVLRVDHIGPDVFGIACRTDDYSLSFGAET